MEVFLRPVPRVVLRLIVFVLLALFGLLGTVWWNKLFWLVTMAFFCGTYRVSRISEGHFERRMVVMFVPLRWKRWPLEQFVEIEVLYEDPWSVGRLLPIALLNFVWVLWFRVFDWLVPWFGGSYKLRLRPAKGARIVAWQGNSEANFQTNVELLQDSTGLAVRRRS